MTGILKKYIELKGFSNPEEYLSIVKKKGYEIPPGTAISDTNTPLDNLFYTYISFSASGSCRKKY